MRGKQDARSACRDAVTGRVWVPTVTAGDSLLSWRAGMLPAGAAMASCSGVSGITLQWSEPPPPCGCTAAASVAGAAEAAGRGAKPAASSKRLRSSTSALCVRTSIAQCALSSCITPQQHSATHTCNVPGRDTRHFPAGRFPLLARFPKGSSLKFSPGFEYFLPNRPVAQQSLERLSRTVV